MSSALLAPKPSNRGDAYVPVAATTGAVSDARIDPEEWTLRLRLAVDERARLAASLGNNIAVILRNHGLVTIGETVDSAFLRMYRLILACEVQLKAMMTGQPLIRISDHTLEKSAQRHEWFFRIGPGGRAVGHGELDFSAVMRWMAKLDPACET